MQVACPTVMMVPTSHVVRCHWILRQYFPLNTVTNLPVYTVSQLRTPRNKWRLFISITILIPEARLCSSCDRKDNCAVAWVMYLLFWDVTQRSLVGTDVSGQAIGPIFKGQLKDRTNRLSLNVGKYQLRLRSIPEGRISQANNYLVSGRETLLVCEQTITRNQQQIQPLARPRFCRH